MPHPSILIVEDEAPTRAHMQFMVQKCCEQAEVIAIADFEGAIEYLTAHSPSIVLLDINLRSANGFDLLPYINQEHTKVIFVTANDSYAIRAFEVNAHDYLLKPVGQDRLSKALKKVLGLDAKESHTIEAKHVILNMDDRLFVQRNKEAFFISINEISSIQSDDYYTYIQDQHGRRFLYRKSLKEWLDSLPEHSFVQIHRSVIINLTQVERFVQNSSGGYDVHLKGLDTSLPMSRRFKKAFLARFEDRFTER